jgi:hypothetical protein
MNNKSIGYRHKDYNKWQTKMDIKTRGLLASPEFQKYLVKTYLKTQLIGMIRVFQGRYAKYMTVDQMNEEIKAVEKSLEVLNIEFLDMNRNHILQGMGPGQKVVRERNVTSTENRCHARVWDVSHLVWQCDGRVVYGCQCKNSKISGGSSNYCRKHIKKLTHEDWFAEPSEKMRRHFTKGIAATGVV